MKMFARIAVSNVVCARSQYLTRRFLAANPGSSPTNAHQSSQSQSNFGISGDKARMMGQANVTMPGGSSYASDDRQQQQRSAQDTSKMHADTTGGLGTDAVRDYGEPATDLGSGTNAKLQQEQGPLSTNSKVQPQQQSWSNTGASDVHESKANPYRKDSVVGSAASTGASFEANKKSPFTYTTDAYNPSGAADKANSSPDKEHQRHRGIVETIKDLVTGTDPEMNFQTADPIQMGPDWGLSTVEAHLAPHKRGAMDIVEFLKGQHEIIKSQFNLVASCQGDEKQHAFYALRRLLAVHETAEELIVHPVARTELNGGNAIVDARLKEEHDAKEQLAKLEGMDVTSAEFERELDKLKQSVLAHAEAEEKEEFEKLGSLFDKARLDRMRAAAQIAQRWAPTRPHPGVESAAANMLVGPLAAMMDRIRDALTGKRG